MSTLNLTSELERLISDIVGRTAEFGHIDPRRLLVCVSTTRGGGVHGTYAKIHPLRFAGGEKMKTVRRGRRTCTCTMPTVTHRGMEMLYVIYFLVPRFLNLSHREKLVTIFHELYHVSPDFDGDIRRFPGRNYAHGSSTKKYNAYMAKLVDAYLKGRPEENPAGFLEGTMEEIRHRYRAIVGRKLPMPKLSFST
jgi:Putative phage metallopeptidase